ncbi:XTP/dITP diphosphatase [Clostridium tepidum]|jgi:XTP/dITP diphosphohydrolase|uniref:dITP/XTP pyrophosphatase n=1 Tax=Clostridium tepidum TaxID=1962263 RepID=A0A1S9I3R2_9CLOT|nr:XTP/dITP diphosphatase [Clostridium tepidum]MCR1934228.1 XTP/dITP diphosphatase [Clostridium tepidum]MDU6877915.1 XTP/dITP diphosphatase [Clostridium botulinum]OOO62234.1 non-canonical purine NTP pyrophosphatase, RdgB/HAM1 family [Clostridium tepidum]OOO64895.1 non-canonical purine NTP pyrophosphatase, RdgB/HAM1 family [Clostridium tepidum]
MTKEVIVASNNKDKIKEIKEILREFNINALSMKEAGIDIDIEEDGNTFMENAYKKASTIHKILPDYMVIADDSGLMVDALNGAPGIYSARFAGEHGNYKKNNEKLLRELEGKKAEERSAKFVCSIVFIINKDDVIKVQGEINGIIGEKEIGEDGFGYDPLFYVPEYNKTFAQMDSQTKNSISHRGRALKILKCELEKYI